MTNIHFPIRVLVMDDHPLIRDGIRSQFASETSVAIVGEGSAGEHLEPLVASLQPDVVMLDLRMPQREGGSDSQENRFRPHVEVKKLLKRYPQTRYLVISQDFTRAVVMRMMDAGVSGYMLKHDANTRNLVTAITMVAQGNVCVSAEVSDMLVNGRPRDDLRSQLSQRQLEILAEMAKHPDILHVDLAARLGISENTLKRHVTDIRGRLGVRTNTAAILRAVMDGLVPPEAIELVKFDTQV